MSSNKDFVAWLNVVSSSPHWETLTNLIRERRDGIQKQANDPGDTDFQKGQLHALDWVLAVPNDLLSTVDDTIDPSTKAEG